MAEKTTFIKVDRNILEWKWFKNAKVYQLFSWLILKANVKDHLFEKDIIPRGSVVTSYESMANGCGMSVSTARRVVSDLEKTGEIERVVRDHYQVIRIIKYDEYQGCSKTTGGIKNEQPLGQPVEQPLEQPLEHQYKNNKNIKNGKKDKGRSAPVPLTGNPKRGTEEFRRMSHILLKQDEGELDDIPVEYRDTYQNFADYWGYRNQ